MFITMGNNTNNKFGINRLVWQTKPNEAPKSAEVQAQHKENTGPRTVEELRAAGEAAIKAQQDYVDALERSAKAHGDAADASERAAQSYERAEAAYEEAAYQSEILDRWSNPLNWLHDQFTGPPPRKAKTGLGGLADRMRRSVSKPEDRKEQ